MSGRRLSRALPPVVNQAVMTKLGTRPGAVVEIDDASRRALVKWSGAPTPMWTDFSALYDATGLLDFAAAVLVFHNSGGKLSYVIPGHVVLPVHDLYSENGKRVAEVGYRPRTSRILVKEFAPRFLEVSDDAAR